MKETKLKVLSIAALGVLAMSAGFLAGCTSSSEPSGSDPTSQPTSQTTVEVKTVVLDEDYVKVSESSTYFAPHIVYADGSYASAKDDCLVKAGETVHLFAYGLPEGWETGVVLSNNDTISVAEDGTITVAQVTEKKTVTLTLVASDGEKIIRKNMYITAVPGSMYADDTMGYVDYTQRPGTEREKMAGQLEKYMLSEGIAPIGTRDNGGYQLYHSRIHTPFLDQDLYVPSYGYGLLTYGTIDAELEAENVAKYKMFLHELEAAENDVGNFNYLDASSGAVDDFYSFISSGYFGQFVNAQATGAQWEGILSRTKAPVAISATGEELPEGAASDTWKIKLRVGADADGANGETAGLVYRTNTANATLKAFDGRKVALKDYLTPFKLLATGAVGWYRGDEQAAEKTANRQVTGFKEYYNGTTDVTSMASDADFCDAVDVKIDETDNSITIKFNGIITADYAEYQLNGVWSNPVPEEYIATLGQIEPVQGLDDVLAGAKSYGKNTANSHLTPFDTILALGPWYNEYYESKKVCTFAKNEQWPLCKDEAGRTLYQLAGIYLNINSAIGTNKNEYIEKFEAGLTDYSNIPSDYWNTYVNDPRKHKVEGSLITPYSLKMNMWDAAFWDENFGDSETEWDIHPCLSNDNFYKGLAIGIDRVSYANYYHSNPRTEMVEPANMVSPKASSPYASSDAHKDAVEAIFGDTLDDFENWEDNAAEYFELAIEEELAAGHYELSNDATNPTKFTITLGNYDSEASKISDNMILGNWKSAFDLAVKTHLDEEGNRPWVDAEGNSLITLDATVTYIAYTDDDQLADDFIYNGVQAGKFDAQLVYYISGNALDVLNGFDKYKSDNSSGFSLNFCCDTSVPSAEIFYEGRYWSFDALWEAANAGTFLDEHGKAVAPCTAILVDLASNAEGEVAATEYYALFYIAPATGVTITGTYAVMLVGGNGGYFPVELEFDEESGCYILTIPAENILAYSGVAGTGYFQLLVTWEFEVGGETVEGQTVAGGAYNLP